ncbi:hypothetical protein FF38_07717 [Lucilia cuprina]|uniref:Uncharacterized protein n=1 Tax=Lucilia cuprina TaxID=7375 RepID=A0A0L0BN46_LUCCU|nr:hypothetical protein FF38_07717 [Lucilia cuprina]
MVYIMGQTGCFNNQLLPLCAVAETTEAISVVWLDDLNRTSNVLGYIFRPDEMRNERACIYLQKGDLVCRILTAINYMLQIVFFLLSSVCAALTLLPNIIAIPNGFDEFFFGLFVSNFLKVYLGLCMIFIIQLLSLYVDDVVVFDDAHSKCQVTIAIDDDCCYKISNSAVAAIITL